MRALAAMTIGGMMVVATPAMAQTGLLVVAHGADSSWNAKVRDVVAQVQWNGPVRTAFLMGAEAKDASWDAGVQQLVAAGAKSLVVVPLMVSSHGSHTRQVMFYGGALPEMPAELAKGGHDHHHHGGPPPVPTRVTTALDDAPELGEALAARWRELPAADRARPLVLVAHGPNAEADVPRWIAGIRAATAPLAAALGDKPLHIGLLRDDAPREVRAAAVQGIRDTITALATQHGDSVTVMTVLVSSGQINRVKVPQDLAGMPMRYVGAALAPHGALARWIERVAR
ncbi:MAG TPA: CbiX/SirB N-terminal domain-containing protein [Gemmatimonadales bacterium]|nr:CbiX/SirB N-terminal domain-containing protein [Gemmatimonadales bacterium]